MQCVFSELPAVKSSLLVDRVGMLLFALYQVTVTIVLVNILIAMMSHSFDAVQVNPVFYNTGNLCCSIPTPTQLNISGS